MRDIVIPTVITKTVALKGDIIGVANGNKDGNSKSGGIFCNGELVWIYNGSDLKVLDAETGVIVSSWNFTNITHNSNITIVSVVEHMVYELHGQSRRKEYQPCLVVGYVCERKSYTSFLHARTSRILQTISFNGKINMLKIITPKRESNPLDGILRMMTGVLAVGFEGGLILIVDIKCHNILNELFNPSGSNYGRDCGELTYVDAVNHTKDEIRAELSKTKSTSKFLSFILNADCITDEKHLKLGREKLPRKLLKVTAMLYIPQATILAVGYNVGIFQLWDMNTLKAVYTSSVPARSTPVSQFGFQEPCNDPQHCCYLWVLYESNRPDCLCLPYAFMYSIIFKKLTDIPNYGPHYKGFSHCKRRFRVDLDIADEFFDGRVVACHVVSNTTSSMLRHCNDDESNTAKINLFVMVFETWRPNSNAGFLFMSVFDLNEWYREQMPYECYSGFSTSFISSVPLDSIKSTKRALWDVHIKTDTIQQFLAFNVSEKYCQPSSLSFNSLFLLEHQIIDLYLPGLQRHVLDTIEKEGPAVLINPNVYYDKCKSVGLSPHFILLDAETKYWTETEKREFILTILLEHKRINFLTHCVREWADGSLGVSQCTLTSLINWSWSCIRHIKLLCDSICIPLFDYSGTELDRINYQKIKHCDQLMHIIADLYQYILANYKRILTHDIISTKLNTLHLITCYFDLVIWCMDCNLLPEKLDSVNGKPVPAYLSNLIQNSQKRRDELKSFIEHNPEWLSDRQHIYAIDSLLHSDPNGQKLLNQWIRENVGYSNEQYPPATLQSMLRIYLVSNLPIEYKHSVMLYFLLDVCNLQDDSNIRKRLLTFSTLFCLDAKILSVIKMAWSLDHGQFDDFVDILFNGQLHKKDIPLWLKDIIIPILCHHKQMSLAIKCLNYLQPFSPDFPINEITVKLYVMNNCVIEAFNYQRNNIYLQNRLLNYFFECCQKEGILKEVIKLSLNEIEERAFVTFLDKSEDKQAADLKVLFLLARGRYIEAIDVNRKTATLHVNNPPVERNTCTVSKNYVTSQNATGRTTTRDLMVNVFSKTLPSVTNDLIQLCSKEKKSFSRYRQVERPSPLSVAVHIDTTKQTPSFTTTTENLLQAAINKTRELWSSKCSTVNGNKRSTLTIQDTPFLRSNICTPVKPSSVPRLISFEQKSTTEKPKKRLIEESMETPTKRVKSNENETPINRATSLLVEDADGMLYTPLTQRRTSQLEPCDVTLYTPKSSILKREPISRIKPSKVGFQIPENDRETYSPRLVHRPPTPRYIKNATVFDDESEEFIEGELLNDTFTFDQDMGSVSSKFSKMDHAASVKETKSPIPEKNVSIGDETRMKENFIPIEDELKETVVEEVTSQEKKVECYSTRVTSTRKRKIIAVTLEDDSDLLHSASRDKGRVIPFDLDTKVEQLSSVKPSTDDRMGSLENDRSNSGSLKSTEKKRGIAYFVVDEEEGEASTFEDNLDMEIFGVNADAVPASETVNSLYGGEMGEVQPQNETDPKKDTTARSVHAATSYEEPNVMDESHARPTAGEDEDDIMEEGEIAGDGEEACIRVDDVKTVSSTIWDVTNRSTRTINVGGATTPAKVTDNALNRGDGTSANKTVGYSSSCSREADTGVVSEWEALYSDVDAEPQSAWQSRDNQTTGTVKKDDHGTDRELAPNKADLSKKKIDTRDDKDVICISSSDDEAEKDSDVTVNKVAEEEGEYYSSSYSSEESENSTDVDYRENVAEVEQNTEAAYDDEINNEGEEELLDLNSEEEEGDLEEESETDTEDSIQDEEEINEGTRAEEEIEDVVQDVDDYDDGGEAEDGGQNEEDVENGDQNEEDVESGGQDELDIIDLDQDEEDVENGGQDEQDIADEDRDADDIEVEDRDEGEIEGGNRVVEEELEDAGQAEVERPIEVEEESENGGYNEQQRLLQVVNLLGTIQSPENTSDINQFDFRRFENSEFNIQGLGSVSYAPESGDVYVFVTEDSNPGDASIPASPHNSSDCVNDRFRDIDDVVCLDSSDDDDVTEVTTEIVQSANDTENGTQVAESQGKSREETETEVQFLNEDVTKDGDEKSVVDEEEEGEENRVDDERENDNYIMFRSNEIELQLLDESEMRLEFSEFGGHNTTTLSDDTNNVTDRHIGRNFYPERNVVEASPDSRNWEENEDDDGGAFVRVEKSKNFASDHDYERKPAAMGGVNNDSPRQRQKSPEPEENCKKLDLLDEVQGNLFGNDDAIINFSPNTEKTAKVLHKERPFECRKIVYDDSNDAADMVEVKAQSNDRESLLDSHGDNSHDEDDSRADNSHDEDSGNDEDDDDDDSIDENSRDVKKPSVVVDGDELSSADKTLTENKLSSLEKLDDGGAISGGTDKSENKVSAEGGRDKGSSSKPITTFRNDIRNLDQLASDQVPNTQTRSTGNVSRTSSTESLPSVAASSSLRMSPMRTCKLKSKYGMVTENLIHKLDDDRVTIKREINLASNQPDVPVASRRRSSAWKSGVRLSLDNIVEEPGESSSFQYGRLKRAGSMTDINKLEETGPSSASSYSFYVPPKTKRCRSLCNWPISESTVDSGYELPPFLHDYRLRSRKRTFSTLEIIPSDEEAEQPPKTIKRETERQLDDGNCDTAGNMRRRSDSVSSTSSSVVTRSSSKRKQSAKKRQTCDNDVEPEINLESRTANKRKRKSVRRTEKDLLLDESKLEDRSSVTSGSPTSTVSTRRMPRSLTTSTPVKKPKTDTQPSPDNTMEHSEEESVADVSFQSGCSSKTDSAINTGTRQSVASSTSQIPIGTKRSRSLCNWPVSKSSTKRYKSPKSLHKYPFRQCKHAFDTLEVIPSDEETTPVPGTSETGEEVTRLTRSKSRASSTKSSASKWKSSSVGNQNSDEESNAGSPMDANKSQGGTSGRKKRGPMVPSDTASPATMTERWLGSLRTSTVKPKLGESPEPSNLNDDVNDRRLTRSQKQLMKGKVVPTTSQKRTTSTTPKKRSTSTTPKKRENTKDNDTSSESVTSRNTDESLLRSGKKRK